MKKAGVGEYKKIVKQIIKKTLAPVSHNHSFINSGNNFYKKETDFIKFIEPEYFHWNTSVSFSFWFNLNISYGSFIDEKEINMKTILKIGEGMFFKRSGFLWNTENHMYSITNDSHISELNDKIKDDFEKYVFPFFEKFTSLDNIIQFLVDENKRLGRCEYSFRLAIIMARMGRKEESKKFFMESIGLKEAIIKAARYHGIEIED